MRYLIALIALLPSPALANVCWFTYQSDQVVMAGETAVVSTGSSTVACHILTRHITVGDATIASYQCEDTLASFVTMEIDEELMRFWRGMDVEMECI